MNEFYNKLKYFEETEKVSKEIYYHYTSLDSLYSIVTSHSFRLMSLKSSNDRKELFYKPQQFIADLSRICENETQPNEKEFYGLLKNSLNDHKATFIHETKAKKQPYALCLSTKKDNLTHWDRYANKCTGVSIGFNVKALNVLYQRMSSEAFGLGLFDLGKALYTQEEIDNWIKFEMRRAYKWLNQLKGTTSDDIQRISEDSGYLFMTCACNNVMKFAKTSAFFDENEFRLYHDPCSIKDALSLIDGMKGEIDESLYQNTRKNFIKLVELLHIKEENFAITNSGIRGYHILCLDEIWGSGVIPEIVLGPMCVQNKSELQRFLKQNGLEGTKVTVSSVPIR